jgi:hypothetical protein
MAERADPAVAFSKFPGDLQRAVLAVTHIENESLAFVVNAVERALLCEWWFVCGDVDGYLMQARYAVRDAQARERPRSSCKVVSLAAFRKAR